MTAEHIFGKWMRDSFPSTFSKTTHMTSFTDLRGSSPVSTMAKGKMNNRQGSPHSQQLRVVCETCNNNWMSQLQEAAKIALIALMKNEWSKLDLPSIEAVSAWTSMVTMCLEFSDLKTQVVPPAERRYLMETRTPPPNWVICFGRCVLGNAPGTHWHRAGLLLEDEYAYQTTTICLEAAFAHTLSGPPPLLPNPTTYAQTLGIRQFWPLPAIPPEAPLVFTPPGMNRVATKFWSDNGLEQPLLLGGRDAFVPLP